jgi:hypothetical protein
LNDDLAAMTPDQLRREIRRAKNNLPPGRAALDLWMAKTGTTVERVAALITARLGDAVKRSDERLTRKYGRLN